MNDKADPTESAFARLRRIDTTELDRAVAKVEAISRELRGPANSEAAREAAKALGESLEVNHAAR